MALIKEYMTNKGPVSYWVLALLQFDNFSKTAYTRLYGYYNKTQADLQNPEATITLEVNLSPDTYDYYFREDLLKQEGVSPLTQAYQIFKDWDIQNEKGETFNFKDAIDEIVGV